MGGIPAVRFVRTPTLYVAVALPLLSLACSRTSEGQEAGRRDALLEAKVEEIVPQLEQFSHLPAVRSPAVRRSSAATLETYLLERLDQEYPGDTLENLSLAYQSFGLLPQGVDLRTLLVDLLLEQAIGFYDPAQDVLFIRDEAPEALLDAVIVHEIVHALQDQHTDLDSLVFHTSGNDARMAIQTAMEGHAMAAMMAYQVFEMTGSAVSAEALPELSPDMGAALAQSPQFPQLAAAPAIVREPLLFAYLGGGRYVQRLWKTRPGNPPPFGEWLPESTEQLLHTERLLQERDRPTPLELTEPGGGWTTRYAHDLGELEMLIYFEEHLGRGPVATAAAEGWDGDAYALIGNGDDLALVWYTVWDSAADADEFIDAYRQAFAARFGGSQTGSVLIADDRRARIDALTLAGMPAVRIIESPPDVEVDEPPQARPR